jgi:uncharacterized protein (DUF111 family)
MRLVIDTRTGLAGDIVAAGLIGLGADPDRVCGAMEAAGSLLGPTQVRHAPESGINRLSIDFAQPGHLSAAEARDVLDRALGTVGLTFPWSGMALNILTVLTEAEAHVHSVHPALRRHYHGSETVLHEASDIVMDVMGTAAGLAELGVTAVEYIGPVGVGSGTVKFSHGILDVPAPATRFILEKHGIPWKNTEVGMEAATPTGAAILAGCGAVQVHEAPEHGRKAMAGGTRPLPPLAFFLAD